MSAKPRVANCSGCEVPITKNKTGMCVRCANRKLNADPIAKAKRVAGIRKKFQDPAHRAKIAAVARRNAQKAAVDPEIRLKLIEHGKKMAANYLHTPEGRAANKAARQRAGQSRTETVLGWCPPELRAEYRYWAISRRKPAAEARRIIEAKIAEREAMRFIPGAIQWLNRIARTTQDQDGTIRFGNSTMTPVEAVRFAKLRGWDGDIPEALAA